MNDSAFEFHGRVISKDDPAFALREASWFERAMMFIPVAGWMVASMLNAKRINEVLRLVDEIIKARPDGVIELTWQSERQKEIATILAVTLEAEFGCPAQKLFAEDHLGILCLDDDLQFYDIAEALAEKLALPIDELTDLTCDRFHESTIRQLVLTIESMVSHTDSDQGTESTS